MHENSTVFCVFKCLCIYLIRFQIVNTLCPYFFRLTHGYPYIGIDDISIFGSFRNIVYQCDCCTCLRCNILAVINQFLVWIIFWIGTCYKMHSKFRTCYHKRISHIVTGVSHIYELHTLKFSEMLTNCQHICDHLCRMELIGQSIPHRNSRIFCQFLYDFLSISTILNSIKYSSKYTGCIRNAFLLSDL